MAVTNRWPVGFQILALDDDRDATLAVVGGQRITRSRHQEA